MKINDLIFKEILKRGYSLEGNTRVWNIADSKLWYLTPEQAQAYIDFISTREYKKGIGSKEISLIHECINKILKEVGNKPINLVDLGCGDGRKACIFIEALKKNGVKLRYCPIDISGYMVEQAINNVRKLDANAEVVKVHWNISDFENLENVLPLLRKDEFKTNFFLLLGNTLGNFEIHELLYQIKSGMSDGDILLVGNGLDNNKVEEDVVKACREDPRSDKFLFYIPLQLGFKKNDVLYDVRFRNSRLEVYYTLTKDKTISFHNKSLNFYKGDQIVVAVAYHYEKSEYLSYLNMHFKEADLYANKDGSYSLALCWK